MQCRLSVIKRCLSFFAELFCFPQGYVFNMTLQMWFRGQIALGFRVHCWGDLWYVVYGNNVCRLRLSFWCWMCYGPGYNGGILTKKASLSRATPQTTYLYRILQIILWFSAVSFSFVASPFEQRCPSCIFPESILSQSVKICATCFPSTLILPCLYSSLIQLLFGFSRDSFYTILLSHVCCYSQIYVGAEGWLSNFLHG